MRTKRISLLNSQPTIRYHHHRKFHCLQIFWGSNGSGKNTIITHQSDIWKKDSYLIDVNVRKVDISNKEGIGLAGDIFSEACMNVVSNNRDALPETFTYNENFYGNSLSTMLNFVESELPLRNIATTIVFRNLEYASGKKKVLLPTNSPFSIRDEARKAFRIVARNVFEKQEQELRDLFAYMEMKKDPMYIKPLRLVMSTSDLQLLPLGWISHIDNHDADSWLHFWKIEPLTKSEIKNILPLHESKISLNNNFNMWAPPVSAVDEIWEYTQGHRATVQEILNKMTVKPVHECIADHHEQCYNYLLKVLENFVMIWYDVGVLNKILEELCSNNFQLAGTPVGTPRSKEVEYLVACDVLFQNVNCLEASNVPMQKAIARFVKSSNRTS